MLLERKHDKQWEALEYEFNWSAQTLQQQEEQTHVDNGGLKSSGIG